LGGNRVHKLRHFGNIMFTMVLGGLWHGACWTFLIWGSLHGLALCLSEGLGKRLPSSKVLTMLSAYLTFHWVAALWIVFRSKTIGEAALTFHQIGTGWHWTSTLAIANERGWIILASIVGILWGAVAPSWTAQARERFARAPWPLQAALALIVVESVLAVSSSTIRPFIYFQF